MRSIVVIVTVFICSVLCILSVLTIDSYTLQKDELERALDFAAEQTVHRCLETGVAEQSDVISIATETFSSCINSDRGDLTLYILYADENVIDLAVSFVYTQYNGTQKEISSRKTAIKDWENGDIQPIVRVISEKYLEETPERGGLKENSVWKNSNVLQTVFANKRVSGTWTTVLQTVVIKTTTH